MNNKREQHHVAVQVVKQKRRDKTVKHKYRHLDMKVLRRNASRTMEVTGR